MNESSSKEKVFIPVVLGTARAGRRSEQAANYVFAEVEKLRSKHGFTTEFIDVRDHMITDTIHSATDDKRAYAWRKIAVRADGFILVAPEYNHGYPGELKLLLDRAYDEYWHKPIGICGVGGGLGGARMVQNLRSVIIALQAVPTRNAVYFSGIRDLFDATGKITDDSYADQVAGLVEEVIWYAKALKSARELQQ